MKKFLAFILSICACCTAFAGCASKDDVDSNPSSREDTVSATDSAWDDDMDSSRTFPQRVESTVDDLIDGGQRVLDDTASTADDVVDNITR